jgi:hypothetical protein
MRWRVVVTGDVANAVAGRQLLQQGSAEFNVTFESTGGTERQIVLTVPGTDALDAGNAAVRHLEAVLGRELTRPRVQSVNPEDDFELNFRPSVI